MASESGPKDTRNSAREELIEMKNLEEYGYGTDTESSTNATSTVVSMKDSKLSWLVCFAGFLIQVLLVGILHVWGVFFLSVREEFQATKAEVSWIASAGYGVTMLFGPLACVLIKQFGARPTALVGTILCVTGITASSFAQSLTVMFLTFSLIFGLGCCLAYTPTMCITGDYFDKYITVATGIMVAGSSTGTLILAPISQAVIDSIGWRNALRVLAGFACLTLWSGTRFVPLPGTPAIPKPEQVIKKSMARRLMADLRLWKNRVFIVWTLSITCVMFGYYIPYVHLVAYAEDCGIPPEKGYILVMLLGASTATGRLMFGKIVDTGIMNRLHMHQLSMIVTGVASMLLPLIKSFAGLITYVICVGLVDGCYVVLLPVMTSALVGAEQTVLAWGFLIGTSSFTFTLGPPVAGWLYDLTGSYNMAFHVAGIPVIFGAILLLLIPWAQRTSTSTNIMTAARPTYTNLEIQQDSDDTVSDDALSIPSDDDIEDVGPEHKGKFLIIELDEDSRSHLRLGGCKLVTNHPGRRKRSISMTCTNELSNDVVMSLQEAGALTPSMEKLAQAQDGFQDKYHNTAVPRPRKRTISEGSAPMNININDPELLRINQNHQKNSEDIKVDFHGNSPARCDLSSPPPFSPRTFLATPISSSSLIQSNHSLPRVPEESVVNGNLVVSNETLNADDNNQQDYSADLMDNVGSNVNPFLQDNTAQTTASSDGNSWDFITDTGNTDNNSPAILDINCNQI